MARAAQNDGMGDHLSLMHGWIPAALQLITVAALAYSIAWRGRHWWTWRVPLALAVGAVTVCFAHWYYGTLGLASEPPPWQMWLWTALVGHATVLVIVAWRRAGWWRRNVCVFAASFCMLSTGLTINSWLGYFPSVPSAWGQLTNTPLPDQSDLRAVREAKIKGVAPQRGAVVPIDTGSAVSGFRHRGEWVYLPPSWFTHAPSPQLPALLMVGGEFNTPADWVRAGDAVATLDAFAAAHAGNAPMAVFADATGGFTVDTECVNGSRGNAADHLVGDVIARVDDLFGLVGQPKWGVVGFSSGGTCAVDLAVMHPETFDAFVDIGGDITPNAGTRTQTIERLFGGDAAAWARFDPSTVIAQHGPYPNLAGLFAVPGAAGRTDHRAVGHAAADSLCQLGAANGIDCKVVQLPGRHDWPSAASAFAATLPWLAGRLHTPGVAATAMP
ncbi:MAG: esterase family protein [Mycobacterium sp.]|nr:esterase family protein [Mycobacterium sp.]